MNHEDMLKEMHTKAHTCALSSKLTMQAIICVTMAYEAICSTARAVAAQSHVAYVPHTMTDYLALIDRPAYLAHVAAMINSKMLSIVILLISAGMLFILELGQLLSIKHRLTKLQAASLL